MWLYIAFFQIFLPSATSVRAPYSANEMCVSKNTIEDYKICNNKWTKKVFSPDNGGDNLYDPDKISILLRPSMCIDMMWMIVNIDPFWSFGSLTVDHNADLNNHSIISETLKLFCWPTISNYLYEYKKYYIGKNKNPPLLSKKIRNLSKKRIKRILSLCKGKTDKMPAPGSVREKICKKIGLYLVLDVLHPELLSRPSWFLTLLDPNFAKNELSFLRDHKVKDVKNNEYLKMYNAFVDRIVPEETEKFPVVDDCKNKMNYSQKSLCYIQSIRTVFDLGANVDIQHYQIHDMVTGKQLSALKTNYSICDENKNASVNNLCSNSYSTHMSSLDSVSYPDMSNAGLSTKENILTYMRGRANYEFWKKLKK